MSYGMTPCPQCPLLSSAAIKHFITSQPGEAKNHSGGRGTVVVAKRRGRWVDVDLWLTTTARWSSGTGAYPVSGEPIFIGLFGAVT